jgi:hypothetical protein
MSFDWQGQRELLKREDPVKFQAIKIEQLSSLVGNRKQVVEYHLCSLRILWKDECIGDSVTAKLSFNKHNDATL